MSEKNLFSKDKGPEPETPVGAEISAGEKGSMLAELEAEHMSACDHCVPQSETGLRFVFGEGDPDADIMFVGEGPGEEEDRQGRPFVGRAGKLLDKQITAMGLEREDVYIANIVKVRPPGNRVPNPEEAAMCSPFLIKQIDIIKPKAIVGLGATSVKYLLDDMGIAITKMRGNWQEYAGTPLMPTLHPAYILRNYNVETRSKVWSDLKQVLEHVGLPVPEYKIEAKKKT